MESNGHAMKEPEPLDPDAIYYVNTCNAHRDHSVHANFCDGSCGTTEVTGLDIEIYNELNAWRAVGMNPQNIVVDVVDLQWKFHALLELIMDKNLATEDELNKAYQVHKLEALRQTRMHNEDMVRQARLGVMKRGVLGPDGKPL